MCENCTLKIRFIERFSVYYCAGLDRKIFESYRLTIEEDLAKTKRTELSPSVKRKPQLKITRHLLKKFQYFQVRKIIRKQQVRMKMSLIP